MNFACQNKPRLLATEAVTLGNGGRAGGSGEGRVYSFLAAGGPDVEEDGKKQRQWEVIPGATERGERDSGREHSWEDELCGPSKAWRRLPEAGTNRNSGTTDGW